LIPNGLGHPEHPNWGSWGGRYEWRQPTTMPWFRQAETRASWTDAADKVTGANGMTYQDNRASIWRFRQAFQNDFAARMDWCVQPRDAANHHPNVVVAGSSGLSTLVLAAAPAEVLQLDASSSTDPDQDTLAFNWWLYDEAGKATAPLAVENAATPAATLRVPDQARPGDAFHVILEVNDDGAPALTSYRRIIVEIE